MDLFIGMFIGFFILSYILPIGIQIFICKDSKSKAGLVLPAIIFIVNLLSLIGSFAFNSVGDDPEYLNVFISFLIKNIPVLILYLIYRYYRNKNV